MKKAVYILFFIIIANQLFAQNLVPNPSFEYYTTCPTGANQINYAYPWFNPTGSWSNYFNQCTSNLQLSVPNNAAGNQLARTGNAYAAITTFYATPDGRNYIEAPLLDTLITGKKYCIEFYVSLAEISEYTTNNLGIFFSNDSIYDPTNLFYYLPYIPQVEFIGIIPPDTLNWILISGEYIANGGERFITIGNFRTDANTDTVRIGTNGMYAYYYIDDVSVILCDSTPPADTASTLFVPNVFTPNADGQNDEFKVQGQNIKEFKGMIYNRWGELIYEWDDVNKAWDGTYKGREAAEGIYVYLIKAKGNDEVEYDKHGTVLLIR